MFFIMKKRPDIGEKIEESAKILWSEIWIPAMVFIIMFLGWLHNKYQYTSYFQENMTQAMGSLGNATVSIYNAGANIPGWVWIIIWIGLFYFGIDSIIDVWKPKKENKK